MKAKEYAQLYQSKLIEFFQPDAPGEAERLAVSAVLGGLMGELAVLTRSRGKTSFEAALSCFDEIEKKWRAFCYLIDDGKTWRPDGFIYFIQKHDPELWTLYQIGKQSVGGYTYRR